MNYNLKTIGHAECGEDGYYIRVCKEFIPALKGLSDFEYIQILWLFDKVSDTERSMLVEEKPYKNGPSELGVFATRTPNRPNPIAVTTTNIIHIDYETGLIIVPYLDAFDGTPILDIKPYVPSVDRVEYITQPDWCSNWPKCYEESGDFDWESVLNF